MTRKLTSQELCRRKDARAKEKERERKKAEYKAKIDALPDRWELKLTVHKELMRDVRGKLFIRKICGDGFMGMGDELLIALVMAWEENKSELSLMPRAMVEDKKRKRGQ